MDKEFHGAATTPEDSHTRAFLKIQDGCNSSVAFALFLKQEEEVELSQLMNASLMPIN